MTDQPTRHAETAAAVLLSLAAFATSWAGYQATLWSGDQIQHSNEAITWRAKATRASTRAGQLVQIDLGMFNSWLVEHDHGNTRLATFIAARFRPEFKTAFDAWITTDPLRSPSAPPSPFALPVYHLATSDSAERFEVAADSTTALSTSANRTGDSYVLVAVILAIVLFFASASQRAMRSGLRWMLMAVASVACAGGIVRLFMLPRG